MQKILVIEDDKYISQLLLITLQKAGYKVSCIDDSRKAVTAFRSGKHDLIVTDIMMPYMDGFEVITEIRRMNADVPIIILSALASMENRIKGYEKLADDYITKPVNLEILLLKIKALLRRAQIYAEQEIILANTKISSMSNTVIINDREIELTKKEFLLLFTMLSHPNKIFTRDLLLKNIWGQDAYVDERTVDTHISWLRDKASSPDYDIVTVRGLGYKAVMRNES